MMEEQTYEPLTDADQALLAEYRSVVEDLLDSKEMIAIYQTVTGKLSILRALMVGHFFKAADLHSIQGIGVVLGDALVLHGGFEWCMAKEGDTRTPCLKCPNTGLEVFPLTMISDRLKSGAELDLFELFDDVVDQLPELKKS